MVLPLGSSPLAISSAKEGDEAASQMGSQRRARREEEGQVLNVAVVVVGSSRSTRRRSLSRPATRARARARRETRKRNPTESLDLVAIYSGSGPNKISGKPARARVGKKGRERSRGEVLEARAVAPASFRSPFLPSAACARGFFRLCVYVLL